MPLDLQGPLSGGKIAFAGLAYIGACLYITGPLVGERTIARSNWAAECETLQSVDVGARKMPSVSTPQLDCRSLLGWLGSQGREVCDTYGNPKVDLSILDELETQRQRLRALRQEQLAQKVAHSKSRCVCAVTVTLDRHRTSLGLYAGTARLVTPPAIRNLSSELHASLRSPLCAPEKGGAS